ncbi:MAG: hypothetical protein JW870_01550 [Candidatus Delongbacteria bacterium]|nr:hypothetical protein [Candidatus Delongbacteria bacterium]
MSGMIMGKLILVLSMLIGSFLYAQEAMESVSISESDSVAVSQPEPIKELTEEQKLCEEINLEINKLHESWNYSKDFDYIKTLITDEVNSFYNSWMQPNESGITKHEELLKIFSSLDLSEIQSPSLKELIEKEIDRIKNVLSGNYENPALTGFVSSTSEAFIKTILEQLKEFPSTADAHSELKSIYQKLFRSSVEYNMMKAEVERQIARIVDVRLHDYYIENDLEGSLKSLAAKLGDTIRNNETKILADHEAHTLELEKALEEAKGNYENATSENKSSLYSAYLSAIDAYKNASENTFLKDLQETEVNKLIPTFISFNKSLQEFGISDVFINDIYRKNSAVDQELKTLMETRFYNQLTSKFQVYFKYDVIGGFRDYRTNILVLSIMFFLLFFYIAFLVKKRRDALYIRKIPGLDAIDEAIGRATEMGKPIFYDAGISDISDPQTIASMLILKNVAKKVAEFKAEIYFPSYDAVVMQVADEMISTGYLDAGCFQDYKKENVFFLTNDQFAYASALSGLTARKKPATCFHLGYYAAESLLISEAGFAAGAIQVAGTVQSTQLPFFIAACDHTLIGEELYAAAAYLSKDPMIVSNLKLSDYSKIIFGLLFLITAIVLTIYPEWTFLRDLLTTR